MAVQIKMHSFDATNHDSSPARVHFSHDLISANMVAHPISFVIHSLRNPPALRLNTCHYTQQSQTRYRSADGGQQQNDVDDTNSYSISNDTSAVPCVEQQANGGVHDRAAWTRSLMPASQAKNNEHWQPCLCTTCTISNTHAKDSVIRTSCSNKHQHTDHITSCSSNRHGSCSSSSHCSSPDSADGDGEEECMRSRGCSCRICSKHDAAYRSSVLCTDEDAPLVALCANSIPMRHLLSTQPSAWTACAADNGTAAAVTDPLCPVPQTAPRSVSLSLTALSSHPSGAVSSHTQALSWTPWLDALTVESDIDGVPVSLLILAHVSHRETSLRHVYTHWRRRSQYQRTRRQAMYHQACRYDRHTLCRTYYAAWCWRFAQRQRSHGQGQCAHRVWRKRMQRHVWGQWRKRYTHNMWCAEVLQQLHALRVRAYVRHSWRSWQSTMWKRLHGELLCGGCMMLRDPTVWLVTAPASRTSEVAGEEGAQQQQDDGEKQRKGQKQSLLLDTASATNLARHFVWRCWLRYTAQHRSHRLQLRHVALCTLQRHLAQRQQSVVWQLWRRAARARRVARLCAHTWRKQWFALWCTYAQQCARLREMRRRGALGVSAHLWRVWYDKWQQRQRRVAAVRCADVWHDDVMGRRYTRRAVWGRWCARYACRLREGAMRRSAESARVALLRHVALRRIIDGVTCAVNSDETERVACRTRSSRSQEGTADEDMCPESIMDEDTSRRSVGNGNDNNDDDGNSMCRGIKAATSVCITSRSNHSTERNTPQDAEDGVVNTCARAMNDGATSQSDRHLYPRQSNMTNPCNVPPHNNTIYASTHANVEQCVVAAVCDDSAVATATCTCRRGRCGRHDTATNTSSSMGVCAQHTCTDASTQICQTGHTATPTAMHCATQPSHARDTRCTATQTDRLCPTATVSSVPQHSVCSTFVCDTQRDCVADSHAVFAAANHDNKHNATAGTQVAVRATQRRRRGEQRERRHRKSAANQKQRKEEHEQQQQQRKQHREPYKKRVTESVAEGTANDATVVGRDEDEVNVGDTYAASHVSSSAGVRAPLRLCAHKKSKNEARRPTDDVNHASADSSHVVNTIADNAVLSCGRQTGLSHRSVIYVPFHLSSAASRVTASDLFCGSSQRGAQLPGISLSQLSLSPLLREEATVMLQQQQEEGHVCCSSTREDMTAAAPGTQTHSLGAEAIQLRSGLMTPNRMMQQTCPSVPLLPSSMVSAEEADRCDIICGDTVTHARAMHNSCRYKDCIHNTSSNVGQESSVHEVTAANMRRNDARNSGTELVNTHPTASRIHHHATSDRMTSAAIPMTALAASSTATDAATASSPSAKMCEDAITMMQTEATRWPYSAHSIVQANPPPQTEKLTAAVASVTTNATTCPDDASSEPVTRGSALESEKEHVQSRGRALLQAYVALHRERDAQKRELAWIDMRLNTMARMSDEDDAHRKDDVNYDAENVHSTKHSSDAAVTALHASKACSMHENTTYRDSVCNPMPHNDNSNNKHACVDDNPNSSTMTRSKNDKTMTLTGNDVSRYDAVIAAQVPATDRAALLMRRAYLLRCCERREELKGRIRGFAQALQRRLASGQSSSALHGMDAHVPCLPSPSSLWLSSPASVVTSRSVSEPSFSSNATWSLYSAND